MDQIPEKQKIVTYHKIRPQHLLEEHFMLYREQNILVTVDDGDISFYQYMFPLLKQYKLPAILFIITSLIDSKTPFWWDELVYLLGPEEGEKKAWEVKTWPNQQRLSYLQELRQTSGKARLEQQQLTTTQLLEMQEAGITIANHSHTHPMFDRCTEEELRQEFVESRKFFEERELQGYELLAYPNGNVSPMAEKVAKEEGIRYGFLFNHQLPDSSFHPYRIPRLSVTDGTSLGKLRFILSGWHSRILPLRKKLFNVLHG
jgi:peptidoglycan/xylan/chitin deacetylase (PgdA/CDA1 family)